MGNRKSAAAVAITIEGIEYIAIPKADYLRMQGIPEGAVDARSFMRNLLAKDVRLAREAAGITQSELAERMGKSQTLVSQAESGGAKVSERYVRAVLKACGLPEDWKPSAPEKAARARKKRPSRS